MEKVIRSIKRFFSFDTILALHADCCLKFQLAIGAFDLVGTYTRTQKFECSRGNKACIGLWCDVVRCGSTSEKRDSGGRREGVCREKEVSKKRVGRAAVSTRLLCFA